MWLLICFKTLTSAGYSNYNRSRLRGIKSRTANWNWQKKKKNKEKWFVRFMTDVRPVIFIYLLCYLYTYNLFISFHFILCQRSAMAPGQVIIDGEIWSLKFSISTISFAFRYGTLYKWAFNFILVLRNHNSCFFCLRCQKWSYTPFPSPRIKSLTHFT